MQKQDRIPYYEIPVTEMDQGSGLTLKRADEILQQVLEATQMEQTSFYDAIKRVEDYKRKNDL